MTADSLEENYTQVFDGHIGFGERPAILVIDFVEAYVQPNSPFFAEPVIAAVEQTRLVLELARRVGVPVIYTNVSYHPDGRDGGIFMQKVPALKLYAGGGGFLGQIVESIAPEPSDIIVTKQYASAFFGTSLAATLTAMQRDTVIMTGCSTSGCVRASAVDGMQYGFRVIVPRECVGDRHHEPHEANLFDINAKYGDVVARQTVLDYLAALSGITQAKASGDG
jgi:maleamate amidohydrolase